MTAAAPDGHDDGAVATLRTIADYQFGRGAGDALFPTDDRLDVSRSRSGRPREVSVRAGRLVTLGLDGRFTLGLEGGRRLAAGFDSPRLRVVVGDESEPYVRAGRNVFAKFVVTADPEIRARDEVIVGHERGAVLGVGRAELDAGALADFRTGMAVMVRAGADDE